MSQIGGMTQLSQQSSATNGGDHKPNTNPRKRKTQDELCLPFSELAIEGPLIQTAPSCNSSSGLQLALSQSIEEYHPKQPPHKRHQTEKQGIYRDLRKDTKRMTRRFNILCETDKVQNREPTKIDPFSALPQFEFLEIAEQLATETPSELDGFGQIDLFLGEAADDTSHEQPLASFLSVYASSDEQNETEWESELNEFRHMDSPSTSAPDTTLELPMSSLLSSDNGGEFCPEDIRNAAASMLARIQGTGADIVGPTEDEAITNDGPFSSFSSQTVASRHSVNGSQSSVNHEQFPLDNSPCTSFWCPIQETQNEGPYYHNGVLGDQDHPQ